MVRVHSFVVMAAVASAVALVPLAARAEAQTPPPTQTPAPAKPQETKPEEKPATAASLAGKWTVNIESPQGAMESSLDMKADPKDAKKVGGTLVSQLGETVVEGEVVEGKLTFWITINAGGGDMSVTFTGLLQKDGTLAGTLNFGQGDIPWTAVRVKGS